MDELSSREWTTEEVKRMVGQVDESRIGYAVDSGIRATAASGGVTSAILIYGLNQGMFDGVLVCENIVEDGRVRPHFKIATDAKSVLSARGSQYVETRFQSEAIKLIKSFPGRLAVVGLPCDISGLKMRCRKDSELEEKIKLTIALFCGHNSRYGLVDNISKKLELEANSRLIDFKFREGHWRGRLTARFANGQVLSKPSGYFNNYQNLFFYCQRKCLSCNDHFGYFSDISVGDLWLFKMRANPIKHSAIIVRTTIGKDIFHSAMKDNIVATEACDINMIMNSQARIAKSHYNVSSRKLVGKIFGITLKEPTKERVSSMDFVNAFITILNVKVSESKYGSKIVFGMPRSILNFILVIKKVIETIK